MLINYGNTTNFQIWYDDSLTGAAGVPNGVALSQAVMDYCEYDLQRLSFLFGNIMPPAANLPFQINIVPGGGGAYNDGIKTITCLVNISDGTYNQFGLSPIIVAEEGEIFMRLQNGGWNPGWSNGEGLSRSLAQILYPPNAFLFASGSDWYNPASVSALPDWVDNDEQTDQDGISYGCAALFLNYLAYQLGYKWTDIIAAIALPPNNTLGYTAMLLGAPTAYTDFVALLMANFPSGNLYPAGTPFTEQIDDIFPLGPITATPHLYMRHNLTDDGSSHLPPLSDSPDIILKNNMVPNPQATYSTAASIASDTESDADVLTGQANYVYLRVWNSGTDSTNVFATVYWSPPATLVTPDMWNLIGDAYFPDVPAGSTVEVSTPGIVWPADQIPAPGHYCFVATVGNADEAAPAPGSFASFTDFYNYILANNNITWRNFNVITPLPGPIGRHRFGEYVGLPFLITGAWDRDHLFTFETEANLPKGSSLALQVPEFVGKGLTPRLSSFELFGDTVTDPTYRRRLRIPLKINRSHPIGEIELAKGTALPSHILVNIPARLHDKDYEVSIRQLFKGKEIGRVTWRLTPKKL